MNKTGNIVLILILLCIAVALQAQNVKKNDDTRGAEHAKKKDTSAVPYVPVYLGHSNVRGGMIAKRSFDSLLHHGISARDSAGNMYNIVGFTFSYVERNLYEDSVGKLMIVPDYLSEYCPGDTLPADISAGIYDRTKRDDTAYFDNILLRKQADGSGAYGKPMKFILVK